MLAIEFRFESGTYHATPWGRHVNEGEVEWPPSPWRLLRAFLAGWYLVQSPDDEPVMQKIIYALAQELPLYQLPEAIPSHTRHYMPLSRPGNTALVFDAFLKIPETNPLVIGWQHVSLSEQESHLLARVLKQISYLGRAESWTTAKLLPNPHDKWNSGVDCPSGLGPMRPVRTLAPLPEDLWTAWKSGFEQRESLSPKTKRLHLPSTIWDALGTDTLTLAREKWSQPPGSQWVTYWVPERRPISQKTHGQPLKPNVTTARLILSHHKPMPRIQNALLVGELVRSALIKIVGDRQVDGVLTGHTENGIARGHHHGFFLPEDADNDGYIDHLIIHAGQGLPDSVLDALSSLQVLYVGRDDIAAPNLGDERQSQGWRVALEGYGTLDDISGHSKLLAPSKEWISTTPYLHPWHKKKGGKFGPEEQIRKELLQRGLIPESITPQLSVEIAGKLVTPRGFRKFRRKHVAVQPDRQGSFWRITFAKAIAGPLSLGFGCHYGLGIFRNAPTPER